MEILQPKKDRFHSGLRVPLPLHHLDHQMNHVQSGRMLITKSLIPKDANNVHRDRIRMFQRGTNHVYHVKKDHTSLTKVHKPASHVQKDRTKEKSDKPNAKSARKGVIVMKDTKKPQTVALSPANLVRTTRKPVNTMNQPAFHAKRELINPTKGSQSVYHVKRVYTKEQSGKRTAKNAVQVDIATVPLVEHATEVSSLVEPGPTMIKRDSIVKKPVFHARPVSKRRISRYRLRYLFTCTCHKHLTSTTNVKSKSNAVFTIQANIQIKMVF